MESDQVARFEQLFAAHYGDLMQRLSLQLHRGRR